MDDPKQLKSAIEMSQPLNHATVTRTSLCNLHQQKLQKNKSPSRKDTIELVQILGGIDLILQNLLSSSKTNFPLTQKQLHKIQQVVSKKSQPAITPKNANYQRQATLQRLQPDISPLAHRVASISSRTLNSLEDNQSETQPKSDEFYYAFYEDDTYLNEMFNEFWSEKISNILHSNMTQILIIITPIIYLFLMTTSFYTIYYPIFTIIVPGLLWMPYCIFWALHSNRVALKMIFKSFEFWFKIVYGIIYVLSTFSNYIFLHWSDFEYPELITMARIIVSICTVLAVVTISSFDAVHVKRKWQIMASATYAMLFTVLTLKLQYTQYQQPDDSVVFIYENIGFSLKQNELNAAKIIAIFFWKQAIQTYRFNGRCIMLRYYPYLKYVGRNDNDDQTTPATPTTPVTPQTHQISKKTLDIAIDRHSDSLSVDLSIETEHETSYKL